MARSCALNLHLILYGLDNPLMGRSRALPGSHPACFVQKPCSVCITCKPLQHMQLISTHHTVAFCPRPSAQLQFARLPATMAKAILAITLLLAVAASLAAEQNACPAKYRYQWFYVLNDPTPANLKAVDALVMNWMRDDCGKVITFGQGPAVSTKPATFG